MKVCYFGTYDPTYTRNKLNIQGLRENGVEVVECRTPQISNKFKKYKELMRLHKKIMREGGYDVMIVGFAGHAIMPLAWFLAKRAGKKVILDIFVSEYDSVILDRKAFPKFSLPALKFWLLDWLSCQLSDKLLLDAEEHINYFTKAFKVRRDKFAMIFVSSDKNIFYPREKQKTEKFIIHYHGSYSPIQGVKFIVEAAKYLEKENAIFNIIGKLKNHKKEIELSHKLKLKNINFIDFMPYEQLARQMAKADLVLGMFGDTDKAMHCSAFKIVEGMAMKKPVLTGDTPALRELSPKAEKNLLFCQMGNTQDLADKIMKLKNDDTLRQDIAENGYMFYKKHLTPKATAADLIKVIDDLIN